MPRPQHARDNDPTDLSHQQTSAEPAARVKSSKKPVEYGDHSSTYWAPGWNYQRFSTASLDDIRSIPEDELEKMQAGMREALGEEGVVKWNLDLYEQEQKAAGQDAVPDLAEEAFAAPEARPKSSRRKVEYGDDSSTYWAPGWDYERLSKATAEDIASVPEDEMEKMRAGMREALGEDGFDKWSRFMFEQEQIATGQVPDITQQRPPAYVERYEKAYKGTKWGFVAFRTACYDDEKRWQQFMADWNAILKLPFECHEGRPGVAEAKADCEVHWVQDVQLAGASVDELREKYNALNIPQDISRGQQQDCFLNITDEVIASVLDNEMPDIDSDMWRADAPFVLAVSVATSGGQEEEDHEENVWYKATFKVALEVLIGEFWSTVDSDGRSLPFKTMFLDETTMWWSSGPSPERLRKRRRVV